MRTPEQQGGSTPNSGRTASAAALRIWAKAAASAGPLPHAGTSRVVFPFELPAERAEVSIIAMGSTGAVGGHVHLHSHLIGE